MQRRQMLAVLSAAAGMAILPESMSSAQKPSTGSDSAKESVAGIGGFFFRAKQPKVLAQWYQDHLGVLVTPQSAGDPVWNQQAGPTSFTPFPEKTGYFGDDASKQWMINFRVGNLNKLVAQLQAAGIAVKVDAASYSYGRFAHLQDPEGNGIELWQPA